MPPRFSDDFPEKSPDDIHADMADEERADAERAEKEKARAKQAAEEQEELAADDPHLQKPDNTTHPLNPPPERNSSIIAERDERPGS